MQIHPDVVRDAVTRSAITKVELASKVGIHANNLVGIESDDWNPKWKRLVALCTAVEEIKRERA